MLLAVARRSGPARRRWSAACSARRCGRAWWRRGCAARRADRSGRGRRRAVGELHQAGAVDVDLVEVKRFLVVRLEAERATFVRVPGEVGPPERAVQRRLRHELRELAVGRQPVEHQQPAAGHGHVAQAVPRLVRPLGALREGHVDQQDLVEIEHGIGQRDRSFHLADGKVERRVRSGQGRCALLQCA